MAAITAAVVKELREITGVAMMDCKKALVETDGDLEAAQDFLRKKGQAKAIKKSTRETSEGAISYFVSSDGKRAGLVKVACETDFVARNEIFQNFISKIANQVCENGGENILKQALLEGDGSVENSLTEKIAELGENMQILDCRKMEINNGAHGGYVHSNGRIGVAVSLETDQPCNDKRLKALAKDIAMHIAAFPAEAVKADQVSTEVLEKEKEVFTAQARESGKPENIIEKMIEGRIKKFLKEICVESQPFVKDPQLTVSQLVENTAKELRVKINFEDYVKFQF